jgi:hypothetical protein
MWKRLHVKCPLFLSGFNEIWICLTYFRKTPKYQISSKFFQWELIFRCGRTDERVDMTWLVAFRSFADTPKISVVVLYTPLSVYTLQIHYLLTPWSRVLPEKLKRPKLLKKFPAFYGTRRFITAFTRARYLSLSSARLIQSMPPIQPLAGPF